jgi:hypothetical protein
MRRFWFVLLTVAMALVIALPAGAGKPTKPPKPPKPPASAPVAVYLDADPIWVHEVGDVIWYNVTVQNKTRADVTVNVEYDTAGNVVIDPRAIYEVDHLFSYMVDDDDFAAAAASGSGIEIVGTVTVTYEGVEVVAETSTFMDPVYPCDFNPAMTGGQVTGGEVCIWVPPLTGQWTVSAVPNPIPTRPTGVMMSVRDGVPGNWCTVPDDPDTGVLQERWLPNRTEMEPFILDVFLPGSNDFTGLADGQCWTGGHGVCTDDDCYFAVGTPESFYLYSSFDGTVTLTLNE